MSIPRRIIDSALNEFKQKTEMEMKNKVIDNPTPSYNEILGATQVQLKYKICDFLFTTIRPKKEITSGSDIEKYCVNTLLWPKI